MPSILLIEDNIDVRLLFIEILCEAGFEVDAAPSYEFGACILDSRDYDLVITDARLPDGTGMALADKARERGITALIVTGNAFDKGIDPTKYSVLAKPMQSHLLLATINKPARLELSLARGSRTAGSRSATNGPFGPRLREGDERFQSRTAP